MSEKSTAAITAAKGHREYSRVKRFVWKAFFVIMALGYLSLVPGVFYNPVSTLDFLVSLPAIGALFGYVWSKKFGPLPLWKAYFAFFLVWELFVVFVLPWLMPNIVLYGQPATEDSLIMVLVIAPVTIAALFAAIYRFSKGRTLPPLKKAATRKWYHYKFALTKAEVAEQVTGYDKLRFRRTARGQAVICAAAIAVLGISFMALGGASVVDMTAVEFWVGPVVYGLLGLFIYMEKRWAGPAVLILLTLDKLSAIYYFEGAAIITATATWLIFAPYFYRVYQVEAARQEGRC
jgi:hypothetical protein